MRSPAPLPSPHSFLSFSLFSTLTHPINTPPAGRRAEQARGGARTVDVAPRVSSSLMVRRARGAPQGTCTKGAFWWGI